MAMRDRVGWTGLDAVAAKNTARIVDVINARIALARGNSIGVGIFGSLDINAPRRTGCGTQEASDTLFQAVFVPMKDVNAAIARLKMNRFFGIIFSNGFAQHVAKRHAETFYKRDERFAGFFNDGRHENSV